MCSECVGEMLEVFSLYSRVLTGMLACVKPLLLRRNSESSELEGVLV